MMMIAMVEADQQGEMDGDEADQHMTSGFLMVSQSECLMSV